MGKMTVQRAAERCCIEHGQGFYVLDVFESPERGTVVLIGRPDADDPDWGLLRILSKELMKIQEVEHVMFDIASST